ncbi:saf4 [Malassezia furfur]|nr:saf4 [Malassezia furfur]
MQGFNMGRYRPWDEDDRDKPFKPRQTRREGPPKFGKVVRFELPFHVCLSCNERIGQGVRFNAEKRQVGQYYSTPIWLFRCKCPSCKSYFAIQTDPEHTRYVVESGAREQLQDWNPEEHGGFPIYDGAFSQLVRKKTQRQDGAKRQARIEELEEHNQGRWADPYARNAEMRRAFRADKKARLERAARDADLRERIGWSDDLPLVGESSTDPGLSTPVVRRAFHEARAERPRSARASPAFSRTRRAPQLSAAGRRLAGQLLAPGHAKR